MFCPDKQHCINEHQTLQESEDPVARFMRKVKKLPGENGCWIWKGTTRRLNKRSLPYGFFNPTSSTCIAAYRYAYQIFKGPQEGTVSSPRGTLAHTVRHTVPRDLFLVELPYAEWLA